MKKSMNWFMFILQVIGRFNKYSSKKNFKVTPSFAKEIVPNTPVYPYCLAAVRFFWRLHFFVSLNKQKMGFIYVT